MKYLMLVCGEESALAKRGIEDGVGELDAETAAWVEEMRTRGVREPGAGSRLRSTSTATTVRTRDHEILVVDGPFAETKEQILGYDVIECKDLDEAIEVASKHPVAGYGSIELRPIWPS
jgi:hypothetical protein